MKITLLNKDGSKALCIDTQPSDAQVLDLRESSTHIWNVYAEGELIAEGNKNREKTR